MERPETVYSSDPEGQPRLLLVDAGAVPEVFVRVVEAKRYLQSGEAETAAEAARMAGISRSAFYKYKEAVFPYDEERAGHILTVHLLLRDRPGHSVRCAHRFCRGGSQYFDGESEHSRRRDGPGVCFGRHRPHVAAGGSVYQTVAHRGRCAAH